MSYFVPGPGAHGKASAGASLQRRLTLLLLAGAAVLWAVTLTASFLHARHEINELFDTQQIRLARQVYSTLPDSSTDPSPQWAPSPSGAHGQGEAELADLSIAVWDRAGHLLVADREGVLLPRSASGTGFRNVELNREQWRVYSLHTQGGPWEVAVGQRMGERKELIFDLVLSQLSLWILALPVLLVAILGSVRHALRPLRALAQEVEKRNPDELEPLPEDMPGELKPLVHAMNRLFGRVGAVIEHERQMTADAAHELRTPIAALQAQLEVAQMAQAAPAREQALSKLDAGIERLGGLVGQLLALARVEALPALREAGAVRWDRVMEQVLSDCLPQADRRQAEIECEWPPVGGAPLALDGDEDLLAVMLRNLVDNAVRYAQRGARVNVVFGTDAITVEDNGPGVRVQHLGRLGDRFYRPPGQGEPGSGLGLSIVRRIAELHGLDVRFENRAEGGFRATLRRR
ncbi:MAG TPA: ATP-binding protein [Burkholderiales bacterium]|nr:ATP-binding protein [Burkholderiales bacterium]